MTLRALMYQYIHITYDSIRVDGIYLHFYNLN